MLPSSPLGGRLARRRGVPPSAVRLSCSIASVLSGTPADRFYGQRVGRVGYKQVSRIRLVAEPAGKVLLVEDGRHAIVDRRQGRWLERLDGGLRVHEAPKIERIAHALLLVPRTALSAMPDSP